MLVIKGRNLTYTLLNDENEMVDATSRDKLKKNKVIVGDDATIEIINGQNVITSIKKRKNILIRPVVANIDQLCIILSQVPKPNFLVIDKLLLRCYSYGIKPIICINKIDICLPEFISEVKSIYSFLDVVCVSAKTGENISILVNKFKDSLTALAGASAVGKSSIINNILPNQNIKTNGLCAKVDSGKHTTKRSEIFPLENGAKIIDTPGFSLFDIEDYDPYQISYMMPDFMPYNTNCSFQPCSHISEQIDKCAIKQALKDGKINKTRYDNYVMIFKAQKPNWRLKK